MGIIYKKNVPFIVIHVTVSNGIKITMPIC